MKKTAVVHFADDIHKLQVADPEVRFGPDYYTSPQFLARPNSTLRLNLVNFTALRKIARTYPVRCSTTAKFTAKLTCSMDLSR